MSSTERVLFRVIWGDFYKGMEQQLVMAFDPDEALVVASELRPELPRPRVAILVGQVVEPTALYNDTHGKSF